MRETWTLSQAERFVWCGRQVRSFRMAGDRDGELVSLYSRQTPRQAAYIGLAKWENLPQIANIVRGYRTY